jgi:hypothetical protein
MWLMGIASSQRPAGKVRPVRGKGRPTDSPSKAVNGGLAVKERNLILEEDRQG